MPLLLEKSFFSEKIETKNLMIPAPHFTKPNKKIQKRKY